MSANRPHLSLEKLGQRQMMAADLGVDLGPAPEVAETAAADPQPVCYLKYKLDRCFVKSWSISGDADDRPTEDVGMAQAAESKEFKHSKPMGWDNTTQKNQVEPGFEVDAAISGDADDRPTEEVAFYYNKIGFAYAKTKDGKEWHDTKPMGWDNTTHKKWTDSGIDADAVDEAIADEVPTEDVAFYYNKIAFEYAMTADGEELEPASAGELLR